MFFTPVSTPEIRLGVATTKEDGVGVIDLPAASYMRLRNTGGWAELLKVLAVKGLLVEDHPTTAGIKRVELSDPAMVAVARRYIAAAVAF